MTASRLGLAVLTAIALALAVLVALDTPPAAVRRSDRVLPGLEPARVVRLAWTRAGETFAIERGERAWRVAAPPPAAGPVDDGVVADVLGALELASATRWGGAADAARVAAAPSALTLVVDGEVAGAAARWTVTVGAIDDATGLAWIATGAGRAARVEAWVARALDRRVDDLRRRVVVPVAAPTAIEVHAGGVDLVLSGAPAAALWPAGAARVAPAAVAAVADALAALRLVTILPPTPAPARPGTIRVLGGDDVVELEDLGACPGAPGRRAVGGTAGTGCVDGAAWDAVIAAARRIADEPVAVVDPAPLAAAAVERLVLADGLAIAPRGGAWRAEPTAIGAAPELDAGRVRALLAALAAPGKVAVSPAPGGPAPAPALTVTYAGGATHTIAVVDATRVRRGDEPFTLEVGAAAVALVRAGAAAVVDLTLLAADPYLLRAIEVVEGGRAVTVTMGDTFDAWGSTTGVADVAAIGRVRELAGGLVGDEPAAPAPLRRTLRLRFDPPPTAGAGPTTVELEVSSAARDGRCVVTVDATSARVAAPACAALLAPLAR